MANQDPDGEADSGRVDVTNEQLDTSRSNSAPIDTESHGETSSNDIPSYLVPASDPDEEMTQVYNGVTHVVGDAPATLRAESEKVAVYVQDELASLVTGDQLNGFLTRLIAQGSPESYLRNSGILPTNESVFGALKVNALPDGKQRVFVVDTSGAGDGYLCSWCTYPDLHLDGHLVSPLDGEHALSISAHELYHAIHRGYDADEEVWMDESLAEAAMTVNGYFTDQAWLSDFLDNPNQAWGPSGADVTTVHYGACLAWGTYLWEQGGPELMKAVTQESGNGWVGLDAALGQIGETRTGWDLFLELGAVLYFDDVVRGLGIRSFDFPRELRVASLRDAITDVEAYGFLHYEVTEDTRLTLEGDGVTAVYVEDKTQLQLEDVPVGVPFDAVGPGVLVITARASTSVSILVD